MQQIPDGFTLHDRSSPLTLPWEPIYARRIDDRCQLAVEVRPEHTNSRGLVHGGLIAALADNAMGLSLAETLKTQGRVASRGAITTTLSIDYLGRAGIGEWLCFTIDFVHAGRRTATLQAQVNSGDRIVARANASFAFE